MPDNLIKETIDDLGSAFESFKKTNTQRLAEINRKGSPDPITTEKLDRLEKSMDRAEAIIRKSYAATSRPHLGEAMENKSKDDNGFENYIRKGSTRDMETKALSSSNGETGGYLVPQLLSKKIYSRLHELSPIRKLASTCEISSDALDVLTEKGRATVGWVAETEKREETKTPEFIKQRIQLHEIFANPKASQRLIDDAHINIEEWLTNKVATEMAVAENASFINGNGKNMPKGILTNDKVGIGKGEFGKIEHLLVENFSESPTTDVLFDVYHSMNSAYLNDAVWMMSRRMQSALRKLRDKATGQHIWQPGLEKGAVNTLLGHPVVTVDELSADENDNILFANLKRGYQIVDGKNKFKIMRDPYTQKPYVLFYVTKRVGGDVVDHNAFKLISFTNES